MPKILLFHERNPWDLHRARKGCARLCRCRVLRTFPSYLSLISDHCLSYNFSQHKNKHYQHSQQSTNFQHIIPNPPESSNIQVSESLSVKVVSPCSCAIAWALPAKDIHGDSPRWAPGLPLGMGRRAARWSHGCKARLAKRCASAMAFQKHWQYCLVS